MQKISFLDVSPYIFKISETIVKNQQTLTKLHQNYKSFQKLENYLKILKFPLTIRKISNDSLKIVKITLKL